MRATWPAQHRSVCIKMMDAWEICSGEHFCVWDLILPPNAKHFSKADGEDVVQLLYMKFINCPWLWAIQQGGEHYRLVDLDLSFGWNYEIPLLTHTFGRSLPKAMLALATLLLTSSSMITMRKCVLPRYVNLPTSPSLPRYVNLQTAPSFCPLTEMLNSV